MKAHQEFIAARQAARRKPGHADSAGLTTEQHVWLSAWLVVAGAENCREAKVASSWADNCLKDFRAAFAEAAA